MFCRSTEFLKELGVVGSFVYPFSIYDIVHLFHCYPFGWCFVPIESCRLGSIKALPFVWPLNPKAQRMPFRPFNCVKSGLETLITGIWRKLISLHQLI